MATTPPDPDSSSATKKPKKHPPVNSDGSSGPVKKKKKKPITDDSASAPTKPKSEKIRKKVVDDAATFPNASRKSSTKKAQKEISTENNLPPSATSAPAPTSSTKPPTPVSDTKPDPTPTSQTPSRPASTNSIGERRGVNRATSAPLKGATRPPVSGRSIEGGRSMRAMPGGRGRGRAAPSQRGIGRNPSGNRPPPPTTGAISAPSRPQSMQNLAGVSAPTGGRSQATSQSMHTPGSRPDAPAMVNGRGGRMGRGRSRVLGRNAVSNRNLPPPPGAKRHSKSKRGLMGSSFHRSSSHHKQVSSHSLGSSDGDEFANDSDGEEEEGELNDAPSRPQSILRTTRRSSGSGAMRTNSDGSISLSMHSAFSISEDEELDMSGDEFAEVKPMVSRMPSNRGKMIRPGLMGKPDGLGQSNHSMRGWTESFRWAKDRRSIMSTFSASKSMRSVLTADMEFEEETRLIQWLRYLRIMAPHPHEKPLKRKVRILTWTTLLFDLLTGLVSLGTYDGVTECCDQAILSVAGDFEWSKIIQITVYLYIFMIFAEILPVLREGFPFNLANPFLGFFITFGMFFDDRILEAVVMWVIEFSAVVCEVWIYRLKLRWHNHRGARLKKTEDDLRALRQERRRLRDAAQNSDQDDDSVSSEISFDEKSFKDESNESSLERPKDVSQIRETRLLRERRLLRQAQSEDRRHLRYHFGGVTFNIVLVCCSLLGISLVGKNGGLCVKDGKPTNIFKSNPLEDCSVCKTIDWDGFCETGCEEGKPQCYFPYY